MNWNYTSLAPLPAWKQTESIIATALSESYPALHTLERRENGSPQDLQRFLARLPDASDQITIVYLAAHQTPSGRWYFPDGSVANWDSITARLPKLKQPNRVVLLDCCHAQAAALWPEWSAQIAPASIFASPANQTAPDLFVFRRRPVDAAALFPKAVPWLRQHRFADLDERVSFFGLVWLETWLERPASPQTPGDWKQLGEEMVSHAQTVAEQVRSDACSEITLGFPN